MVNNTPTAPISSMWDPGTASTPPWDQVLTPVQSWVHPCMSYATHLPFLPTYLPHINTLKVLVTGNNQLYFYIFYRFSHIKIRSTGQSLRKSCLVK